MKHKLILFIIVFVLALAALACGSSGDVEVREPSTGGDTSDEMEDSAPDPTKAPKVGTARSNPAPAGSEVETDDMAFMITGSTRPADNIVSAGNQFNSAPESGQEYVFVDIEITCQKSTDDKCTIFPTSSFSLIGNSGVVYDPKIMLVGVEGLFEMLETEFYGDSKVSGSLAFIINQSDIDLVLIYEPFLGDSFYLAVP